MERTMPRALLVVVQGFTFDYTGAFRKALQLLKAQAEVIEIPPFMVHELDGKRLNEIKEILRTKRGDDALMIFCPGTAEYFLDEPDFLILFSAYERIYDPSRMRVVPHPWSLIESGSLRVDELRWDRKPPAAAGFMGQVYSNSRIGRAVSNAPRGIQHWLLGGTHLTHLNLIAFLNGLGVHLKNINTFARVSALEALRGEKDNAANSLEIEIVNTAGFSGTENEKIRYADHLKRMTYVVCPRGIENFSIRVYEALKFGRVPVIVDSWMVLPQEVDWDLVSIRVPFNKVHDLRQIIWNDYCSKSSVEFATRQEAAFATMAQLDSMDWLKDVFSQILSSSTRLSPDQA
jgi:hypothetical protein